MDPVNLKTANHKGTEDIRRLDAARILVVEDEPELLQALRIRLTGHGYEVTTARDGVEAMKEIRTGRPDLVLLDLHVPAGNGFKICERMRGIPEHAGTPVIAITADPSPEAEQRCFELGCVGFFMKPYDPRDLIATIERTIGA